MKNFLLLIFLIITMPAMSQSYKVMTYNIRYDNPGDGVNAWGNRKTKVTDLIKKYDPDILGVQEALYHQLNDIVSALPDYTFIGVGRDDGKEKGEFSAILYKKSKFEIEEKDTYWLSESPNVTGSKSWDAQITRIVTWAKLKDKKKKRSFVFLNTHFDHIGQEARRQSAVILKDHVAKLPANTPVIITGDFNCIRSEAPYEVMTQKSGVPLSDTAPANPPGTFCNFQVSSMECRGIDYIFYTSRWEASDYTVIADNDGAHYPSDHLPVLSTLKLKKK